MVAIMFSGSGGGKLQASVLIFVLCCKKDVSVSKAFLSKDQCPNLAIYNTVRQNLGEVTMHLFK